MSVVQVDGTVVVALKRSWLFPPSLLVPDIPIRATIKLGVRDGLDVGKVGCSASATLRLTGRPRLRVCRVLSSLMNVQGRSHRQIQM